MVDKLVKKNIFSILLFFSVIFLSEQSFASYIIDGSLDEWGVTPGPFGNSDWIPNDSIYFTEEDQITDYLGPGYGGQQYDAEAMYVDFDSANLYFAVVTGYPGGQRPGDIAFDFGIDGSYEYGIETKGGGGFSKGSLYRVIEWLPAEVYPISNPFAISNADLIYNPSGTNLVYNKTYYGKSIDGNHYVIEGYIPYSYFGSDWGGEFRMHWTMWCGNDAIDIDISPTPEPASLLLLGTGLLMGAFGKKYFRQTRIHANPMQTNAD